MFDLNGKIREKKPVKHSGSVLINTLTQF